MATNIHQYYGKFSWIKENKEHGIFNSLCYENNTSDPKSDPYSTCHPMHPCSKEGLILPIFFEENWGYGYRIVIYFLCLLYSFLGISIVADIFMCAIEKITSKTKKITIASQDPNKENVFEVQVWNATVANLTLMALGSSAPEILLSVIEIIGNNFEAGALGPGTIVGSAAFNLMAISAVCVSGLPDGETRRINQIGVFGVTASFSIFAYLWLLIVLKASSPDVIEIWEASLTLIFFPLLVVIAYAADKRWVQNLFGKKSKTSAEMEEQKQIELGALTEAESKDQLNVKNYFPNGQFNDELLANYIRDIKKNTKLSNEEAAVFAASKIIEAKAHSRMWYRIGAVRKIAGGKKTEPTAKMSDELKTIYDAINKNPECPNISYPDETEEKAIVEFKTSSIAVLENVGTLKVSIIRHGNLDQEVKIRVQTVDGSAVQNEDYKPINQILTFQPKEKVKEKAITIDIVDDNKWEPDELFFVKLTLIPGAESEKVGLGKASILQVTILNDDYPGTLQFDNPGYLVKESCGNAEIGVVRQNGADGKISVKWRTINKSAIEGKDFVGREGEIKFDHGETHQVISIRILDDFEPEKDEKFEVELFEPQSGAKLGNVVKTVVTITNDDEFNSLLQRMVSMTNSNLDQLRVDNETWGQQIMNAMTVNGGDVENATFDDYLMHLLTFGFKVTFAFIPPPSKSGGWPCFFVALGMIGLLTAIVGDLANIFGCLIGLKPSVTAITFVALGTSLPDTFASKAAAVGEKYADNAIGNITGSNSVNVFLGLGLPWLIASIYHAVMGTENGFEMKDKSLSFSVLVFTICAVSTLAMLMIRRYVGFFGKAELGGPDFARFLSSGILIILWLAYVGLASMQAYGKIDPL